MRPTHPHTLLPAALACTLLLAACSPAKPPAPPAPASGIPTALPAPMRALIVAGDAVSAKAAQDLCAKAGLETETIVQGVSAKDAPALDVRHLWSFRTVVLAEAKGDAVGGKERSALEGFVQAGGGLLVVGGSHGNWAWLGRLTGRIATPMPDPKAEAARPPLMRAFDGGRGCFAPTGADAAVALHHAARLGEPAFSLHPDARLPTDDFFQVDELVSGLEDPMEIAPLPDGRVLILERQGAVKLFTPGKEGARTLAQLKTYAMRTADEPWYDGGGMGIAVDPDFGVKNDFVYIYYSTPNRLTDPSFPRTKDAGPDIQKGEINRLSRFRLVDGEILAYETPLLDIAEDRYGTECHQGGSLAFGKDRQLFISSGDNTNPFISDGYSPSDERPGRFRLDAQRSSGNTNDLRGGILRIRVKETGDGYTIPEGNLFKPGTEKTRPEIFVKGCRNPWRIAYDSVSGGVAWGDVGPDAYSTHPNRGPIGYDLIGFAPQAGFYGWPYARGPVETGDPKLAFYVRHDFATGKNAERFSEGIRNTSPNNTGLVELPRPKQALVWYPHNGAAEFPEMGTGGRSACVSVVYNQEGRPSSMPPWFHRVLISHEWMRTRLDLVKLGPDGKVESIAPFLRSLRLMHPSDMAQDGAGNLYLLDYGTQWLFNKNGRLLKIAFKGWKRPPMLALDGAERFGGPGARFDFDAQVSTADDKAFSAKWDFGDGASAGGLKASHVYPQSGRYRAKLVVTDADGVRAERGVWVSAGNTHPRVSVAFPGAPAALPWGGEVAVAAKADDAEDGDLSAAVALSAEYGVPLNRPWAAPQLAGLDPALRGAQLMVANSCIGCHNAREPGAGPAYSEVARRYFGDPQRPAKLAQSITRGSSGKWHAHMDMPSFSNLPAADVADLVAAIESLDQRLSVPLPVVHGKVQLPKERPSDLPSSAVLTVRARVSDKGAQGLAPLAAEASASLADAPASQGKPAAASSSFEGYPAANAFDGNPKTRWNTAPGQQTGWLEVDLQRPTAVSRAVLMEKTYARVGKFALEAQTDSGAWKPVAEGTTIGANREIKFPAVTTRKFRLNILAASDMPSIDEFQLFEK